MKVRQLLMVLGLLLPLPLLGVYSKGLPIGTYAEFPPTTQYVEHAGFSWVAFGVMAVGILAVVGPFVVRIFRSQGSVNGGGEMPSDSRTRQAFPWWGWAGIALGGAAWVLAWTRFEWMGGLQRHTFTPLWIAYIVVVNALTYRRTGHCLLKDRPVYVGGLFVASAFFWWFFEYLNRFVQNWYYTAAAGLSPWEYFWFATFPFSTVLPAVLSTAEWLESKPRGYAGLESFRVYRVGHPKLAAGVMLLVAGAGLTGIGIWPDFLYPLLWVAPLLIITSLQALSGQPTIFSPLQQGDWRRIWRLAMAALICGFFWEMWNYFSLAKWYYTVPFVHRFLVFEMPLLGFAGYLPFGLECAVIADMLVKNDRVQGNPASMN